MRTFIRMVPALALLIAALGCGGGDNKSGSGTPAPTAGGTTPPPSGEKTPIEIKPAAVLKGTVTYDGEAPKPDDIKDQIMKQDDKAHCLKADPMNTDPDKSRTWVVKDGKVANVAVWVRAPAGKYFKFSPEDVQSWGSKVVTVDQPFCHFDPHVQVTFPEYWDPKTKKLQKTNVVTKVLNSAPISHNTKWKGDDRKNPFGSRTIQAKDSIELPLQADVSREVSINCDIHKWMDGYIWALDTPFAAVSKEDGTFEIKGLPAGAEVMVTTWHENGGFGAGGQNGKKMTLKEGDNVLDFKVKAK